MDKILKPYTIVPPHLYVQRDADRQIENIIADMGRPGYVLVSRQMGKTNLLLSAKKNLQTESDIFVYIDLSNPFDSLKSCFENIIDTTIETNSEKFSRAGEVILSRRTELKDTPPHKQHINELRILLNSIEGKLVIILDEIDALTKTNYSDLIFAQIRSVYFSRANFPELNRLTYILSGVIEPNEIIKDPKISPFNIGQKIFLNDFSKSEFNLFLSKSDLNFTDEIKNRIFYWTGGNPRIMWDLCAELETQIKSQILTIELIDKIVNDIYLTSFDKPPVDNIRELVKNDRDLRNAIIQLENKKEQEISDKIRNKLYLAGIINFEENSIHIKNEIIRKSLSVDWLWNLEKEQKGLINIAMDSYRSLKYEDALLTFEKFLEENEFEEDTNKPHYYYIMGHCAYSLNSFEKALGFLNMCHFILEEEPVWYYKALHQKALVYYFLNRFDESLECLKKIIDANRKDEAYSRALLNFGSISLASGKLSQLDIATDIFNQIINENEISLKPQFTNELKSIAYYNLAQIQVSTKKTEDAIINYKKAIQFSVDKTTPTIILALLQFIDSEDERFSLCEQVVKLILEKNIKPTEQSHERPLDFSFEKFREILLESYANYYDSLFQKIKDKLNELGEQTLAKHIYDLAIFAINEKKDWEKAIKVLKSLYANFTTPEFQFTDETKYSALKLLAFFGDPKGNFNISIEYIALFTKKRFAPIDYLDLEIFANIIYSLSEQKRYIEALSYVNQIVSFKDSVHESIQINFLAIYHLELNIYSFLGEKNRMLVKAKEILDFSKNPEFKTQKSNLLGETGLELIKQNAANVLFPNKPKAPAIATKSFGRNQVIKVRYKDGTILESKYKKVEKDLISGECSLIR